MLASAATCCPLAIRALPPRRLARRAVRVCAQQQQDTKQGADDVDDNISEYCSLDPNGKRPVKELTTADKEAMFLEAMAGYYFDGKSTLSNEEFDNLKQELQWEGSQIMMLTKEEMKLLEARQAYTKGKKPPLMSDQEYDALKDRLKAAGSMVFKMRSDVPSCSLDRPPVRGQKQGEADVDMYKMFALQFPAVLAVTGLIAALDLATGGSIAQLPTGVAAFFWGGIVVPFAYVTVNAISRFLFKDALVLRAPCPNCGEVNLTYFGDILTIEGSREQNTVKCSCCSSQLTFDAKQKAVIVTQVGTTTQ